MKRRVMSSSRIKITVTAGAFLAGVSLMVFSQLMSGYREQRQGVARARQEVAIYDKASAALNNLRLKGVSFDLAKRDVSKMSAEELRLSLHSTLDQTTTVCHRKLRMGKLGDGGWEICDDVDMRPRLPCVVYSFGINYEFSFDDMTTDLYGCHVYSFDQSMKNKTHNRSTNVHFYKIGLSDKTFTNGAGWKLYKFKDIRKMLGHQTTTIDVVKMDIKNSEWAAVRQMFQVETSS